MRGLTGDRGSVLVVMIAFIIVSFAIGAVVFDVAGLFHNRRFLQNGADAGALAIAQMCAAGDCGDPSATTQQYADYNSNSVDGTATLDEVCGSGVNDGNGTALIGTCPDPPNIPAGASYVRVTLSHYVAYTFGRLIGVEGNTMRARATVAWGGPSGMTSELPVTFSKCEYDTYTGQFGLWDGSKIDIPDYPADPTSAEATVYFHTNTDATPCPAGPAGSDLPGGFGWLQPDTDKCQATSDINGWWDDKTGRAVPSECTVAEMKSLVGTIIHIPLFTDTNDLNGTNGQYYTGGGYASFYLTGFSIEGQYKADSLVTGRTPCAGEDSCISGFFVNDDQAVTGTIGGPSLGVTVIQLIA
jgi:hypothetical protein